MLVPVHIEMGDGRAVEFSVTAASGGSASFALGIRKSGSSLFSNIAAALATHNNFNVIDIPGTLFEHGYRYHDWNALDRIRSLIWPGNVYVGFRDPPTCLYDDAIFRDARKILLVRDPRDALVSEYFSNAFSHSLPSENAERSIIAEQRAIAQKTPIAEYVLDRARQFDTTFKGYIPLVHDPKLLVIRYEDVIFDKAKWIGIVANHFGWTVSAELAKGILSWADVRPASEDPRAFVRKVAPGDHKEKLSSDVITKLNAQLSPIWQDLGYYLSDEAGK
jgi:hypothetical protein